MSDLLHFSEHTLQEVALVFMATVYTIRIFWLLRFKAGKDRQAQGGIPGRTDATKGALWSLGIVAMPWAMESQRTKPLFYLQFVLFHLGVAAAIGLSFIIPYLPGLLEISWVQPLLQTLIGAAFVVGLLRVFRRLTNKHIRHISSPDDIFAVILLTTWFAFAWLSVPNSTAGGEGILLTYFIMTAFFLMYVPFSKIGHYLYYPFTRYYLGKTLGYRGVYPLEPSIKPEPRNNPQASREKVPASAQA